MCKPLAEYLIMFINGEGLKKYKEWEEEEKTKYTQISSIEDVKNKKRIKGVNVSKEGLIEGTQLNVQEFIKKLHNADVDFEGKGKIKSVDVTGLGIF